MTVLEIGSYQETGSHWKFLSKRAVRLEILFWEASYGSHGVWVKLVGEEPWRQGDTQQLHYPPLPQAVCPR